MMFLFSTDETSNKWISAGTQAGTNRVTECLVDLASVVLDFWVKVTIGFLASTVFRDIDSLRQESPEQKEASSELTRSFLTDGMDRNMYLLWWWS